MNLSEIKATLGVERIPFDLVDPAYPEWRSHFDSTSRVQFVMPTAVFDKLKAKQAVELFLYTTQEQGPANAEGTSRMYTKHLIGEQEELEYL